MAKRSAHQKGTGDGFRKVSCHYCGHPTTRRKTLALIDLPKKEADKLRQPGRGPVGTLPRRCRDTQSCSERRGGKSNG